MAEPAITEATPQPENYDSILRDYIAEHSEEALYHASLLSQSCIESGLGPEDLVALHFEALDRVQKQWPPRERPRVLAEAQQFLLEVMIAYGVKYREYLELKLADSTRDADARVALERQRALDAERLETERAEILAVVAHELRTPLTAALGQIDLATRSVNRGNLDRLLPALGSARSALSRLSRLSADLVEASRGRPPTVSVREQDLAELIAQACAWAGPAAEEKQQTLEIQSAAEPVVTRCDPDAMLSVLGNLLSNAVRYTPEGGRITVRYGSADESAWLEVEDTGIGMSPESQQRMYEKFYRAPEVRQTEVRGLGLGLTLVQQLVQAHEGQLRVESALGKGTRVRVLLPRAGPTREGGQG